MAMRYMPKEGGHKVVMVAHEHGGYVLYSEHRAEVDALKAETDKLRASHARLVKALEWALFKSSYMDHLESNCQVCGWPLQGSATLGCVPGNCSYRPPDNTDEWYRIEDRRKRLEARAALAEAKKVEEPT